MTKVGSQSCTTSQSFEDKVRIEGVIENPHEEMLLTVMTELVHKECQVLSVGV